jgi:hemolysin activation/secretion protein
VVVYLPEQPLSGGQLVLAVLEGRIAKVTVVGNVRAPAEQVRASVPQLQEGKTPQVRLLDTQLRLANENPARKLALTLQAGAQPGEVDAQIKVTEEAVQRFSATLDNTGNAQTGRARLTLGYQHAQPFGSDHPLAVQVQLAPEKPSAVRIVSASYRVPLYGLGWLAGVYGTYSDVDAGNTPTAAGALQFNGKGRVLGLSLTRPLARWGEAEQRFGVSLDTRQYLNNCVIEGLPAGACGSAGESVSVLPLTLDYAVQGGRENQMSANLSVTHNLGAPGRHGKSAAFEAVRPGAAKSYSVLRAGVQAGLALPAHWRLGLRASGQATGDALVSGEQFGLSGANHVRGYGEREITGDSGLLVSAELSSPPLWGQALAGVAFVDAGVARNRQGTACLDTRARCDLAAWGLGLRFAQGPVQLKLDVASALRAARQTARGDVQMHAQISFAF